MYRFLLSLIVVVSLSGCSSSSNLEILDSTPSSGENAVDVGDYTFSLALNDSNERKSLMSAELHYEGTEESVDIQHSSEILYYEIFDQDNNVVYSEFPTNAAAQTTLIRGESSLTDLNVSLSDFPASGEYRVIDVASFTDLSTNKKFQIENTLSFELE